MAEQYTESNTQRYHWTAKLIFTFIIAVIGAIGEGIAGMMMLMIFWG